MDHGADSYRRFLDGDDGGLAEIIRDYNEGLTLYINSFVNDLSAADELSEDTFVKLGIRKPRFSGRSGFRTWLYAIGRNVALDHLRRNARRRTVPLEHCAEQAGAELPETQYLRQEQQRQVHQAMARLKSEYRQVLWLTYFEQFSAKEAAAVMKKSVHSVENLVSRARQALRAELDREGYVYEKL